MVGNRKELFVCKKNFRLVGALKNNNNTFLSNFFKDIKVVAVKKRIPDDSHVINQIPGLSPMNSIVVIMKCIAVSIPENGFVAKCGFQHLQHTVFGKCASTTRILHRRVRISIVLGFFFFKCQPTKRDTDDLVVPFQFQKPVPLILNEPEKCVRSPILTNKCRKWLIEGELHELPLLADQLESI